MILYLHGLNSGGTSGKAGFLRQTLAPIPVISPTYPAHLPMQAVYDLQRYISELLEEHPRFLVVGSSMGGFYGQYLARRFRENIARLVLINPALKPWDLLADIIGEQYNEATGERYQLTAEDVEQTRQFGIEKVDDGIPTTLLLDKGDEAIDYRIAEGMYKGCGELFIFEGGDHRFQHMDEAIEIIRERYRREVAGL
jgi:predicted esterase YcpF (UPF0227 family)